MKKQLFSTFVSFIILFEYFSIAHATSITIDASAPAKPIRFHNFYAGYHHNRFYFERSPAFKRLHDIFKECSHKRPSMQYWRCQNLLTYRNDPNNPKELKWFTEERAGHPYDTERYQATGGYNWGKVDEVFDEIVNRSGMTPVVEFNYMPECMALDLNEIGSYGLAVCSPPKDHLEWTELIRNTVIHLQNRYGVDETRKWYWGVWNEPDHEFFWNPKKYSYYDFIKMYDYAAVPLKEIDNQLKIGGPDNAGIGITTERFVEHTFKGTNFYNGKVGSPAEYFSVHSYSPIVKFICNDVWKMCQYVRKYYGDDYKNKRVILTEMSPSYVMDIVFIQTRFTAAWLLGLVDTFLEAGDLYGEFYIPATMHHCGDLRDFGVRALWVYIGEDNNSTEILKTAPFNTYEMLSYLSEERLPVQGCDFQPGHLDVFKLDEQAFNQVRCLATRTPGQSVELLVYHFNQQNRLVYNQKDNKDKPELWGSYYNAQPITHQADITVTNIPFKNAKYRKYVIDKYHSDVAAFREMNGRTNDYNLLNKHDDLEMIAEKTIEIVNGNFRETLTMQENSALLIILENMNVEPGPHLGVSPTSIDFGAYANVKSITIGNHGDQPLIWNALENPEKNWITSIEPSNGTIAAFSSQSLNISIDRSGLSDGDYRGSIAIHSNGGNQDVEILMYAGQPPLPSVYRINAGGNDYTDLAGNSWSSDRAYSPGGFGYEGGMTSSTSDPIYRTDDDILYQSERYKMDAYRFDVENGNYQIKLHFAEIYFQSPNERIMSVMIEDEPKIVDLDIFQQVGHDAALTYTFSDIPIADGRLDITFSVRSKTPKISAIELIDMNLIDFNTDNKPPSPPQNVHIVHE